MLFHPGWVVVSPFPRDKDILQRQLFPGDSRTPQNMVPLLDKEGLQLAPGVPLPILWESMELGGAALHSVPIQGLAGLGTNFGS